jgi:hypothetical protein
MKSTTKEIIIWTPRVICVVAALFMFLFAFDAFNHNYALSVAIAEFLNKLLPVFIIILLLLLSMRWALVGSILFNLIGLSYIIYNWGEFSFVSYFGVTVPLFVVGVFFLVNWIFREEIESR